MNTQLATIVALSALVKVVMSTPVPQKLTKLVPVPENFLDWPAFARRQVLTAMDHEVLTDDDSNHEDVRHLMRLHQQHVDGAETQENESDLEAGEVESSVWSSSWQSSSLESNQMPWRTFPRNIVYRYLGRYDASSVIASDSSYSSEAISAWPGTGYDHTDRS